MFALGIPSCSDILTPVDSGYYT